MENSPFIPYRNKDIFDELTSRLESINTELEAVKSLLVLNNITEQKKV